MLLFALFCEFVGGFFAWNGLKNAPEFVPGVKSCITGRHAPGGRQARTGEGKSA